MANALFHNIIDDVLLGTGIFSETSHSHTDGEGWTWFDTAGTQTVTMRFKLVDDENPKDNFLGIEKVIFNPPATVVYWEDGSKTIVQVDDRDEFSEEVGLAMAIAKRYFGNNRSEFKRAIESAYRQPKKK